MRDNLTAGMQTAIAAENSSILHFLEFHFATIKDITGFADAGGGNTTVSCASHGMSNGDTCTIYGTSNFNGEYTVSNVASGTFRIVKAYAAGDDSGYLDILNIVRLCTAPHDMSWDSKTWSGVGGNIGFEAIQEGSDLSSFQTNVVLSGVDQTVIAIILSKKYIGRECIVWRGHIGSDGLIVADPVLLFWGEMNGGFKIRHMKNEGKPGTVEVVGTMTDQLGSLEVVNGVQTNVESHQRIAPGDEFMRNVPSLMMKNVIWGED